MSWFVAPLPTKRKNLSHKAPYFYVRNYEGSHVEPHFSKHQVLTNLGLTPIQARVYLALAESGPLTISAISTAATVARPDVYRTLSKLQKIGLVEKIIRKPLEYRAVPMKEGLSLLLETRTHQYEKVRAETQIWLNSAQLKKKPKKVQVESPQFVLIPKGRTVINRIKGAIESAEKSIDLVLSWKRFSRGITSTFDESMEIAWAKNVRARFIIERPQQWSKTVYHLVQFCRDKPSCQVRFIPKYPKTIFGIYDKKEAFIILMAKTDLPGSAALWSTNPSLIGLAQDHFEVLWFKATEESQTLQV
jgi:sugar-specific transcriptional regulator TrmB